MAEEQKKPIFKTVHGREFSIIKAQPKKKEEIKKEEPKDLGGLTLKIPIEQQPQTETSTTQIQTSSPESPQPSQEVIQIPGQPPIPLTQPGALGQHQIVDLQQSPDMFLQKILKQFPGLNPEQRGELIQQIINLVMQLGSSARFLSQGLIDERKMATINELEQVALGHFNYRGQVDGIRYYDELVDWILTSSQGVGGLRARQIIDVTAATSGQPKVEVAQQPNVLARHLWNRDWKEKAQQQGQVVVK